MPKKLTQISFLILFLCYVIVLQVQAQPAWNVLGQIKTRNCLMAILFMKVAAKSENHSSAQYKEIKEMKLYNGLSLSINKKNV